MPGQWRSAYSAAMLPAVVFRLDDPVLALISTLSKHTKTQSSCDSPRREVFQAEDSLGWTYQFWRAAEKKTRSTLREEDRGQTSFLGGHQLFTETLHGSVSAS